MRTTPTTRALRALAAAVACLAVTAPMAQASQHSENSTGEENEFGVIRAPYQLEINGRALVIEAHVKLHESYEDQRATFFMFAFDTQDSPAIDATFVALETADGTAIKVSQKQGEGTELVQWFVDVSDLPPMGSKIVMRAQVEATSRGFFSLGALVMPFNYKWEGVKMSDGDEAKLYAFTQLGVNAETGSGGKQDRFGPPGGGKLPVPGFEALLGVAAVGVAALGVAHAKGRRLR